MEVDEDSLCYRSGPLAFELLMQPDRYGVYSKGTLVCQLTRCEFEIDADAWNTAAFDTMLACLYQKAASDTVFFSHKVYIDEAMTMTALEGGLLQVKELAKPWQEPDVYKAEEVLPALEHMRVAICQYQKGGAWTECTTSTDNHLKTAPTFEST
jgi:hypothetical protein